MICHLNESVSRVMADTGRSDGFGVSAAACTYTTICVQAQGLVATGRARGRECIPRGAPQTRLASCQLEHTPHTLSLRDRGVSPTRCSCIFFYLTSRIDCTVCKVILVLTTARVSADTARHLGTPWALEIDSKDHTCVTPTPRQKRTAPAGHSSRRREHGRT